MPLDLKVPSSISDAVYDQLHLVLITGMSGAGKSVALRALEDSGYFCVDNLPTELIIQFLYTIKQQKKRPHHVAIAVDGRTAGSLHLLPQIYQDLKKENINIKLIFLNANNEALIRRFSETRRRHPLSKSSDIDSNNLQLALKEAIKEERWLLTDIHELGGAVIDSSLLRPAQLQTWVKNTIEAPKNTLTLVFESFAFKRGIPVDADYVFDVRILPNPYYEHELRVLTGKDEKIKSWLESHEEVEQMHQDISHFLRKWIPHFVANHRSYLTVAIGCTGGQHRSVYFVEKFMQEFAKEYQTITRHRELD